jgi:hypothetical protein
MSCSTVGDWSISVQVTYSRVEVGGAQQPAPTQGASMDADLDLLLIAVFCTADDLLPERAANTRRD